LESETMSEWQPIETAPKGLPSEDVGCRDASEWFLGLRKDGQVWEIQRRGWPQDDGWRDRDDTTYTPEWFTHWMPLPQPPEHSS
jgi:hypothetical protein